MSVHFIALPDPGDPAPVVIADADGTRTAWDPAYAAWHCSCQPADRSQRTCRHIIATARVLPVAVATHLARALISSGQGTPSTRRAALLAPAALAD